MPSGAKARTHFQRLIGTSKTRALPESPEIGVFPQPLKVVPFPKPVGIGVFPQPAKVVSQKYAE